MSSTEVAVSPTKKKTKQKMDQIVSSGDDTMNNDDVNECNNGEESSESQTTLINNLNDTNNKECHVADARMEPLLIQDCVSDDENKFVVTNTINSSCDEGGGDDPKPHLTLNLASSDSTPKNKKFLDSSEDQIMNQIFFQTISVTPTAEDIDDILNSRQFINSDGNTPLTPNLDFFNRKIDEDEAFDLTADNYQPDEGDPNLCSLNDNFNENYCSFSSIDYNTTNVQNNITSDSFLGEYAEQMRQQRPSIVIDCYDDDSENSNEEVLDVKNEPGSAVSGSEGAEGKIKDYCFYFDQTIEEDDDALLDDGGGGEGIAEMQFENGKTLEQELQGEEECLESDDYGNEDPTNDEATSEDDEGIINESINSTLESFGSESTVVKKTVKKSVKSSSKTTTKKKTVSEETSSITTSSSKAESFENSFSNGSLEMVEHQESKTSSKSIDTSTSSNGVAKEHAEAIEEHSEQLQQVAETENGVGETLRKKGASGKKKSRKKRSDEKENISVKSSFSKFDALQKKNMQSVQNGDNGVNPEEKKCHACEKVVFQMEQIKAEKKFWHRSCFRCNECSKQLNVDTYQSHEGVLYCKPHFKSLFAPKAVEESSEPVKPRKLEMIILESQPIELPPDVVRSSDKSDLGLDELHQIDLRQRFQLFENGAQQDSKVELEKGNSVKRSTSILSKLARFQSKGMDVGIVDDSLNGICYEHSSSSEGEDNDDDLEELDENHEDIELLRAKRASRKKEKPCSFKEMHDIMSKFESGQVMTKDGHREERKQELQNIRSRLFMGKQAKIKEMYQQAVADSEQTITSASKIMSDEIGDKAKSIKEKFEKGEIFEESDARKALKEDEMAVFEQGIGKQSRSLFLELDASSAAKKSSSLQESPSMTKVSNHTPNTPRQISQTVVSSDDIVRSDAKMEDVQIETADILSKFKFFETYKPKEKEKKSFRITPPRDYQGTTKLPSPEKEVYRDPHIARNEKEKRTDQDEILELQKTTSKMLSMFRQLEEKKEPRPSGPKPLKRFTPPPDGAQTRYQGQEDSGPEYSDEESEGEYSDEEYSDEEEQNPNYIKSSHKNVDEFLKTAQSAERAKKLREKFEKWEENEIKKEMNNSSVNLYEEAQDEGQMETAKSLRARFEQMQKEEPKLPTSASRNKVNRFV